MKREEKIAQQFLRTLEMGEPIYEPDGNIPPDFSLTDGRIGVEVRRLNETDMVHGKPQGTDEFSMSFWPSLKKILKAFDTQYDGATFWVSVDYRHDIRRLNKSMKKKIMTKLQEFLDEPHDLPNKLPVTKSITLEITESIPLPGRVFRLPGGANLDESTEVLPSFVDNIMYCIQEKSAKIDPYLHQYSQWWLILVDHLGWPMLDSREVESIAHSVKETGLFSKVYIIDRRGNLLLALLER